ncbi:hypothetical protein B0H11DRAFT_1682710, partial [Mycena galericulata]
LANWLEGYAEALYLDVWTSSTVTSVRKNSSSPWNVVVDGAGKQRMFQTKRHIFCHWGLVHADSSISTKWWPLQKQMLHLTQHKQANDQAGKKATGIGA